MLTRNWSSNVDTGRVEILLSTSRTPGMRATRLPMSDALCGIVTFPVSVTTPSWTDPLNVVVDRVEHVLTNPLRDFVREHLITFAAHHRDIRSDGVHVRDRDAIVLRRR